MSPPSKTRGPKTRRPKNAGAKKTRGKGRIDPAFPDGMHVYTDLRVLDWHLLGWRSRLGLRSGIWGCGCRCDRRRRCWLSGCRLCALRRGLVRAVAARRNAEQCGSGNGCENELLHYGLLHKQGPAGRAVIERTGNRGNGCVTYVDSPKHFVSTGTLRINVDWKPCSGA